MLTAELRVHEHRRTAGVVESQVFTGTGAAAGVYAYAYQFGVNNVTDTSTGQPTSVNSASMLFNATPVVTSFTRLERRTPTWSPTAQVGGINVPQAAPGMRCSDAVVDRLAARHVDRIADVPVPEPDHGHRTARGRRHQRHDRRDLDAAVSQQHVFVSLQNPEPQNGYPVAYSPTAGTIDQVPAPEPATILAWTSVIAALAVGTSLPPQSQDGLTRIQRCGSVPRDGIAIAAGPRERKFSPSRPSNTVARGFVVRRRSLTGVVSATNLADKTLKVHAAMNKLTYALALGAGLVLSLAAPNAQADPIVQTLTPTDDDVVAVQQPVHAEHDGA